MKTKLYLILIVLLVTGCGVKVQKVVLHKHDIISFQDRKTRESHEAVVESISIIKKKIELNDEFNKTLFYFNDTVENFNKKYELEGVIGKCIELEMGGKIYGIAKWNRTSYRYKISPWSWSPKSEEVVVLLLALGGRELLLETLRENNLPLTLEDAVHALSPRALDTLLEKVRNGESVNKGR